MNNSKVGQCWQEIWKEGKSWDLGQKRCIREMTNLFDDSAGRDAEVHSMRVLILIIYRSDLFTDVIRCLYLGHIYTSDVFLKTRIISNVRCSISPPTRSVKCPNVISQLSLLWWTLFGHWMMTCALISNVFSNGLLSPCGRHIEHSNRRVGHARLCRD